MIEVEKYLPYLQMVPNDTWAYIAGLVLAVFGVLIQRWTLNGEEEKHYLFHLHNFPPEQYFHFLRYRWLIPAIFHTRQELWQKSNPIFMILSGPALIWALLGWGVEWDRAIHAVWFWIFLPCSIRFYLINWKSSEPFSQLLLLLTIGATMQGWLWLAIPLVLLGGLSHGWIPTFALAATLNPWLLIGYVPQLILRKTLATVPLKNKKIKKQFKWVNQPYHKILYNFHLDLTYSWRTHLLPWGGLIIASTVGMGLCDNIEARIAFCLSVILGYASMGFAAHKRPAFHWGFFGMLLMVQWFEPWWLIGLLAILHPFTTTLWEE
jgi:hypothetical protein